MASHSSNDNIHAWKSNGKFLSHPSSIKTKNNKHVRAKAASKNFTSPLIRFLKTKPLERDFWKIPLSLACITLFRALHPSGDRHSRCCCCCSFLILLPPNSPAPRFSWTPFLSFLTFIPAFSSLPFSIIIFHTLSRAVRDKLPRYDSLLQRRAHSMSFRERERERGRESEREREREGERERERGRDALHHCSLCSARVLRGHFYERYMGRTILRDWTVRENRQITREREEGQESPRWLTLNTRVRLFAGVSGIARSTVVEW